MKYGFSRKNLTPNLDNYPVALAGYAYYLDRYATGINDSVGVSSIALQDEQDNSLLFLNPETIGVEEKDLKLVSKELHTKVGIDQKNVFILPTHTHSAPETARFIDAQINEKYIQEVYLPSLVQAGEEAFADLREGKYSFSSVSTEDFCFNRVVGNRVDIPFEFGKFADFNEKNIVYLANFACHPVILNADSTMISRDLFGVITDKIQGLEDTLGSLITQGNSGNIDPSFNIGKRERTTVPTPDNVLFEGEKVFQKIGSELTGVTPLTEGGHISVRTTRVEVPYNLDFVFNLPNDLDNSKSHPGYIRFVKEAHKLSKKKLRKEKREVTISALKIGDKKFVITPFEVYNDSLTQVDRKHPKVTQIGLGNGFAGYLPPREAYLADPLSNAGYSSGRSAFYYRNPAPYKPESLEIIDDNLVNLLNNL